MSLTPSIFYFVVPFTNNNNATTNSNDNLSSNSTNDQLKVLEYYEEEYAKVVGLYEKLKNNEEFKNYSYFLLYYLKIFKKSTFREQLSKELCNRTIVVFKDWNKLDSVAQSKFNREILVEGLLRFLDKDNIKVKKKF